MSLLISKNRSYHQHVLRLRDIGGQAHFLEYSKHFLDSRCSQDKNNCISSELLLSALENCLFFHSLQSKIGHKLFTEKGSLFFFSYWGDIWRGHGHQHCKYCHQNQQEVKVHLFSQMSDFTSLEEKNPQNLPLKTQRNNNTNKKNFTVALKTAVCTSMRNFSCTEDTVQGKRVKAGSERL